MRAWVLFLVLLLAATAFAAPPPSYYPLEQGATWVYLENGARVTRKVVGPQTIGPGHCMVVERRSGDQEERLVERSCYSATEREVLLVQREAAGRVAVLDPPRPVLLLPPAEGKMWTWGPRDSQLGVLWTDQWVKEEAVRVPAGTFRAWKVHSKDKRLHNVNDTWYAAGVGMVRHYTVLIIDDRKTEITVELVSYRLR